MLLLITSALAQQPAQSHYVWMSGLTHLHGVAYDDEDDYFFATDSETYYVYRFDNWSSVTPNSTISYATRYYAGSGLQGMAYDPDNERVYFLRSGTVFYANDSLTVQGNFSSGFSSASDIAFVDGELYIIGSGTTTIRVYDTATHTYQRSISAPVSASWPSIGYDEHQDVIWMSYWNGGSPTPWYAIDPSSGSSTTYSAVSGGHWGHGGDYNDGYFYLGTETRGTDGVRVMTIDCDDDSDGYCNADDNCPSDSNSSQGDADSDGDGDACDECTDVDGDGYGDTSYSSTICDEDCDDNDADQNPAADEYCTGEDDDCDGTVDEDGAVDASTWYQDGDSDGFGLSTASDVDCYQPSDYVSDATDCDDGDGTVYPNASELCDGQDNDCDSSVPAQEGDDDADGYVECTVDGGGWDGTSISGGDDCDDTNDTVYPTASELCDGLDNDCSGAVSTEELDHDSDGWIECSIDSDGWDGAGINGGEDCDDENAATWPGAAEICDREDNDCDSVVPANETDDDVDTWAECEGDCDDADATSYPGGTEVAYDGIDQDCDGADLCDVDGDTWDAPECGGDDCDDSDDSIYPGAEDAWYDGVDSDCAENSDFDSDGDGYDSKSYGGEDCDDADADVYPGAPDEPGDGIITDCDAADEYDADGDGFDGSEYGGTDCDDANSSVNPGAEESWYDGVDQDCDGNDDDQDGDGFPVDLDCDDTDPGVAEFCGDTGDSGMNGKNYNGGGGCEGCSTPAPAVGWLALLALGVAGRRRRK